MNSTQTLSSNRRPLVVGEVLFDEFEDGAQVLGGAPFNVAWHLQGFGISPPLPFDELLYWLRHRADASLF